jgi:predicted nuclease of predicted toxin-antitoxin system
MKILVDMNLSPRWAEVLAGDGFEAVHWSAVGNPRAPDRVIMEWARDHDYLVFTHDLDFGSILAVTKASGPSVIQLRTSDPLPERLGPVVAEAIRLHEKFLAAGALVVIDEDRLRVRILPLNRQP